MDAISKREKNARSNSLGDDIPSAEPHLLDTDHFALEEEVDRIGSLVHEFLDRTIDKK
jgi:hypothetical protein